MTASANMYKEDKVGLGITKPPQGVYSASANQVVELGYKIQMGDRVYRYSYAGGTALTVGVLVKSAQLPAEVNKAVTAASAGVYEVTVTTAAAQLYLQGGYMVTNGSTPAHGAGQCYRIRSSKANATTATSTDLVLYDPLETAITATTKVELYGSPYYDLDIAAAITDHCSGIPPIAVPANYYFWLQTWGPCSALCGNSSIAVGDMLIPLVTTGAVDVATAFTSNIVGYALADGTDTEFNAIYLRINP